MRLKIKAEWSWSKSNKIGGYQFAENAPVSAQAHSILFASFLLRIGNKTDPRDSGGLRCGHDLGQFLVRRDSLGA